MLSKRTRRARIALACALIAGCQSTVNRAVDRAVDQKPAERTEVNASFVIENNLLRLNTTTIGGRAGRFFIGTAHPQTVVSTAFAGASAPASERIQLSDNFSVDVQPVAADLGGIGEAIVGADAWGSQAVTIHYVAGMLALQRRAVFERDMTMYTFTDAPEVTLRVDGQEIRAIVDTTSPDTLTLPRTTGAARRATARVELAGTVFPTLDIAIADTSTARVGNRLLSKFLVTIDYGRRQVGLWRDPRVPLESSVPAR